MSATRQQTLLYPSKQVLTVSALTGLIRTSIESGFCDVWLEGEISNLRMPGSGHVYCTLKDESSQIRAVLFRSNALRVRFTLREGMCVVVRGRLTVYEPRGEYQIVLETVEPKGIGALQLAFEQLKERLAAEGLFDKGRKKAIADFSANHRRGDLADGSCDPGYLFRPSSAMAGTPHYPCAGTRAGCGSGPTDCGCTGAVE